MTENGKVRPILQAIRITKVIDFTLAMSDIWMVRCSYFYQNVSLTEWRDEGNNLVRIKTESVRSIYVFSN